MALPNPEFLLRSAFWCALALAAYAYLGYPAWLWLRRSWKHAPVCPSDTLAAITIVIAARNEADTIARKIANLRALDYPAELIEIIVVSDGSTDRTPAILRSLTDAGVRAVELPQAQGKAIALNHGVAEARGEIVLFTDARQRLDPGAARALVANFSDPSVGAVSGELMLGDERQGLGLYWRLEKLIRQWESATGSTVGVTGALYAVRRKLLQPLPAGTILDDVLIPMEVVRQGHRVLFEPAARAHDDLANSRREFRRKVRTLTGNYQLLQLAPWLLTGENPARFEFVCHKLLRLVVPFALVAMLLCALLGGSPLYHGLFGLQCLFYALALLAREGRQIPGISRVANLSHALVLLNAAAALALVYFLSGKRTVWSR